jgi:hypothetical protein
MPETLTPYALTTRERAIAYMKREAGATDGDTERVIEAVNSAVGWMEMRTTRKLAARVYRRTATLASCVLGTTTAVSGTGFSALYALDDVVGTGCAAGTRVASITSNVALVLDRLPETAGTVSLTFGSEPLVADGTGTERLYIPEYPVSSVIAAYYLDENGDRTALTLTGARLDKETGLYVLTADGWPSGERNIEIECIAGYRLPSGTSLGHWGEWKSLERICLRAAQVFFQDEHNAVGRVVNKSLLQAGVQMPDFGMPADIEDAIKPFVRMHG